MSNICNQNAQNAENIENLLDNSTTYRALTLSLRSYAEATTVAEIELKRKAIEIREEKRKAILGEDYEESAEKIEMDVKYRRPKWRQLRENPACHCIARMDIGGGGICEAFSNGYAIYFNGNRHAILWIPEFMGEAYSYFHPISEKERRYLTERETVTADEMADQPWYLPLLMKGEDQITINMQHPKSTGEMWSDEDLMDFEIQKANKGGAYTGVSRFPDPESVYLEKERREEELNAMSPEQREAFILYHTYGYKQAQIAEKMGVAQKSVSRYLQGAKQVIRELREQDGLED